MLCINNRIFDMNSFEWFNLIVLLQTQYDAQYNKIASKPFREQKS